MSFASDIIHKGHIDIINKAAALGTVIAGVQTDEVVASCDRYPLIPLTERMEIIGSIKGISEVVVQDTLYYDDILRTIKPDYVAHGDDWKNNHLSHVRDRVIEVLKEWGGELVEFPYTYSETVASLELIAHDKLGVPEVRRPRLKRLLATKKVISIIEAHSGLSALIAEKTIVEANGKVNQFDGMWVSSLCDSTMKGKPDIELVDTTSRIRTIDEIMEVTTKPIILDGDTGGLIEHFEYNIRSLERIGVSAVIIEDKTGLKQNSLFGNEVVQYQDSIENFCNKISAGKKVLRTKDFMIIARIESLILERGMEDALERAFAYVGAGADGIMIHSRKKDPDEIFEFCTKFREKNASTPIVVVPTTFNTISEEEFGEYGVNIVIYANQLIRSAFPAMQKVAQTILRDRKACEADKLCMSIKEILNLIPQA